MPQSPNKITQFWLELKRRKVIKVIAMYAATAFIILEVVDIVSPALLLPSWTLTLVIVLLAIGFPIIVIFSWIFDLTSEGIKKTESIEEVADQESPSPSSKRRLKASDIIIGVLFVAVVILLYPKIFPNDKFKDIRDEDNRISISVMPFGNLSGDTLFNVWQAGFQNLLITGLSNSSELSVRQYQTVYSILEDKKDENYSSLTPSLARELAIKLDTRTFIMGNILKAGHKIRINAQLVNSETEEIYRSYEVEGDSEDQIFMMADSLSASIRNYLEIKKYVEEYDSPEIRELPTKSSEAFQYYILGYNAAMEWDLQASVEWFSKAIESDSTFISAYVLLSIAYRGLGESKLAKLWCNLAFEKRESLPLLEKLMLDHLHAYYYETYEEQVRYIKQILEIDESNTIYIYFLGSAYHGLKQYENAVFYLEKFLDIHNTWGTYSRWPLVYCWLGDSYHHLNNHKREKEVYELGLIGSPENTTIVRYQAICELSQGNSDQADKLIAKYKSIAKNTNHWSESRILIGMGNIYAKAELFDEAEKHFRQALALDPENPRRLDDMAWFLIKNNREVNEGVDLVSKSLELNPDNWVALDTYGWGLYKQGKPEESLRILKKSWDLRPVHNQTLYEHLQEVEQALASQDQ